MGSGYRRPNVSPPRHRALTTHDDCSDCVTRACDVFAGDTDVICRETLYTISVILLGKRGPRLGPAAWNLH